MPGPTTCSALLSDAVAALLLKAGLTSGDYNLSALTGYTRGFAFASPTTVRNALKMLTDVYLFDLIESDGIVKAVMRGGGPIDSIAEVDLAAVTGALGGPPPKVEDKRMQDFDLPQRINVTYQSAALDYQPNSQGAMRMSATQNSRNIVTTQYPILMGEDEARQLAQKTLFNAWVYRSQIGLTLPPAYIRFDAADVVVLTLDGNARQFYVTSVEFGADNLVAMKGVVSDETAVADDSEAGINVNYVTQTGTPIEPTTLLLFEAPLLRPVDDSFGFYAGSHGNTTAWRGDVVYKSLDDTTYSAILSFGVPTVAGASTTTLAAAPYEVFDRTNTVRVALDYGTLASISEVNVLNGKNIAMLGDELIGFATATLVSAGVYDLSDLVRGIQGSDWAIGTHTSSDRFILIISDGSIKSADLAQAELNVSRFYKGVTLGESASGVSPVTYASECRRLKPLSAVFVAGSRDVYNNLNIEWTPRARKDVEIVDGIDVGIDEQVEAYDVDVMSGITVLRTIRTFKPSAFYTAANQTLDGLTPGASVSVKVYQLSNRVGRGYAASATV